MFKFTATSILCLSSSYTIHPVLSQPVASPTLEDRFNYDSTKENDYGPSEWNKVQCDDHATCPGWPDDFETYNPFIPYKETGNTCIDCSSKTRGPCRRHKQSPIHLYRNVTATKECKDRHWMHSSTGTCGFEDMKFALERHSLRAYQPLDENGKSTCTKPANIDFSWGFPDRWHLVHTDIKVPSEHMQDGKRYDAEVQLAHIYSKRKEDKLIGKVSIFLEAGNATDRYGFLQLYLNRWRSEEKLIRQSCQRRRLGLFSDDENNGPRKLLRSTNQTDTFQPDENDGAFEPTDLQERRLRRFHAYDWLKQVETEYYFRYEGSQGVPPCQEVVHWRVMKDPIKVAPRQIELLEKLTKRRIDPVTCERDTAARKRMDGSGKVDNTRPIQLTTRKHKVVFCECVDWESKKAADQEWCRLPMEERGVQPLQA